MSPVATWMREQMRGPDVRIVELTGNEPSQSLCSGHVRIDVACPFCLDATCWVMFSADGEGRFLCKPCGSAGSAEHGEYRGRRELELTLEAHVEDPESWSN